MNLPDIPKSFGTEPLHGARAVGDALVPRRSVRPFAPTPVARQTMVDILRVASQAPSGTSPQTWPRMQHPRAIHNTRVCEPEPVERFAHFVE